jgi:DNA-nicking Smr family endonuclease
MSEGDESESDPVVVVPIDGTLDLHTVRPAEAGEMVLEYLEACAERGILEVRIVHGKGIGALRRTVHAALSRSPRVAEFHTADESAGGWGATLVRLVPPPRSGEG